MSSSRAGYARRRGEGAAPLAPALHAPAREELFECGQESPKLQWLPPAPTASVGLLWGGGAASSPAASQGGTPSSLGGRSRQRSRAFPKARSPPAPTELEPLTEHNTNQGQAR